METYEDLEARAEKQQNSVLFSLKRLLFGVEAIDVSEQQSERARIRAEFESIQAQFERFLDRVERALEKPRRTGQPVPDGFDTTPREIRERSEDVAGFRSNNAPFLRADEHEELRGFASTLSELARYLDAKREFDELMADVERTCESFIDIADPYLEYEAYLTGPDEERLRELLSVVQMDVDGVYDAIELDALADGDRDRLSALESKVVTVDELVPGYNETFVRRQRDAYRELFTDIDEAGHSLNEAQQRAVVRNGYLNQVVAGAGTGKTFALVYRVAYLVREGVEPSRIVALTYTTEAAEEMDARLENEFGITNVEVRTIHSFAYKIAQETSADQLTVAQDQDTYNLIDTVLDEVEDGDGEFADHYLQFLYHYDDDFVNEADFDEKTDYIAERREVSYETLNGETVASEAEKVIADFLFTHRVAYRYESIAEWAETANDKQPYRPDFYLPEYDLYIEHWGVDENGEVAPWFSWSTEEYHQKLHWARRGFERNDPELLDTYDFEHEVGRLEQVLRHRLTEAGVELERMGFDEFVDEVFEYNQKKSDIEDSFKAFIENAKTFDVDHDEIPARLSPGNPRQYHFGQCGRRLLEHYDAYLERNDLLDFDDMIYDAIDAIEADPEAFQRRYDHVLVDEFQDVAMSQIRLIDPFVGPEADTRLFCVGDDWQSIYSFQGSQVSYFIDFEQHFGPPEPVQTRLTANYRCPKSVIDASNSLIRNNDDRIEKTVEAHSGRDNQPVLHTLDGYRDAEYTRRVGTYAATLVEGFISDGSDPSEIMVLCRYDAGTPHVDNLEEELRRREIPYDGKNDSYRPSDIPGEGDADFDDEAGVSAFSVHQSKGREAKHVVLLHAVTGPFGFPPDDRDDDLLAPVQDVETNTTAEERRLFYVAMTRATHDLHVVTRAGRESPFVTEVEEFFHEDHSLTSPGETGDRITVTASVKRLWDDVHEKQHQAGVLEDRTGSTRFVSWVNDDPPDVSADTWYKFEGLRVDEFDGEPQLVIDGSSNVIELFDERPTGRQGASGGPGERERSQFGSGEATATGDGEPNDSGTGGPPPAIAGGPNVTLDYQDIAKESSPIGRGGDGVVHGASVHANGDEYFVAIKEPNRRDTLHKETVERFLNEADVWAQLDDHDYVVDVVDWGSNPLPWIAMEYMDGGDMRSRVGSLPFDQAVWTARTITTAVRHAHNRGVRHYDLKPQNILFRSVADSYWDVPKVADWGLAEEALRPGASTDELTPAYAAPEQLFDEYGEPDHRTDIYQLGLLCYELFTGRRAFGGDQTRVRSQPLIPPSDVVGSLPRAIDDVIASALATDPDDRYEDVLDLRRDLDALT
ncbi:MAG: UvrD-helicase domain-containing protein [Haloarculaceae archaeon]